MLKTFSRLLGDDIAVFYRYIGITVFYGLICGVSILLLAFILSQLLLGQFDQIMLWLSVLVITVILCWLLRRIVEQMGIQVGIAVLERARLGLGNHVTGLAVGWFNPQNTASFNHLVTQGMMSVAQLPAHVFTPLITGVVTPLIIVIALLLTHSLLGLIALIAIPIMVAVFWLSSKIAHHSDQVYQQRFAETSQRMVEFAQAQSVFRAFNGEGDSQRFLDDAIKQQRRSGLKLIIFSSCAAVLNIWVIQAMFILMLMAVVFWLPFQAVDTTTVAAFSSLGVSLLLICRFVDALLEFAGYSEVLRHAKSQLEAIQAILNEQPLHESHAVQSLCDHSIEFKDVYFRYQDDQPYVLQGVDLQVASGSMTALIGASGSGKTSLTKLVARFFDANRGQVLIGGVDVKRLPYMQLMGQISQIFQENYLFAGSIGDNIRMGNPNATDDQVMQAVHQAGITEMLARLPEGLNTSVGEGGVRLSGGERQRIAIARALIKDAPILLVDEATAALDAENQAIICELLNQLRGQKTILVIAHQLTTVAAADQIIVLDQGQVVEQGTPEQLRLMRGHYSRYLQQSQKIKGWQIGQAPQVVGQLQCP
ncbi:ABC transporter ATP-binding protein [Acinetobacter proteolyticus]|uniref:ABC transporter ATP-binding protein n=1 Tax=Acinetobacter proteolyticus TaxID=1776741 RepID=UPI0031CE0B25